MNQQVSNSWVAFRSVLCMVLIIRGQQNELETELQPG